MHFTAADDDDAFYTPPSSPLQGVSDGSSDEEMESPEEGPNVFIMGLVSEVIFNRFVRSKCLGSSYSDKTVFWFCWNFSRRQSTSNKTYKLEGCCCFVNTEFAIVENGLLARDGWCVT